MNELFKGDPLSIVFVVIVLFAAGFLGFRRINNQDSAWVSLVQTYAKQVSDLLERVKGQTHLIGELDSKLERLADMEEECRREKSMLLKRISELEEEREYYLERLRELGERREKSE